MERVRIFFFLCSLCAARSAPCTIQRQLQLCGVEGGGYHTTYKRHATMQVWSCGEGSTRDKREEQTNNARHGTPEEG